MLDPAKLAEVQRLMGAEFRALLRTFAASVRAQLAEALGAHAAQDDEALLDAVHRLKNTAGDIGATRLYGAAAMWEQALKAGGVPGQGMDALEQAGREAVAAAEDLQDRGTQA